MTTWVDGGPYGRFFRGIDNNDRIICFVWTEFLDDKGIMKPWHSGKANFRLILKAPLMLEALEEIAGLGNWMEEKEIVCNSMEEVARAAIAAVKGENDETD